MPIRFLLDENVRGPLWHAIRRHNAAGGLPLDVVRVGDPPDLPLASLDGAILDWCEREDRHLVSFDRDTLPAHLIEHLGHGRHAPGIFLIRPRASLRGVLDALELVAHAGDPDEFRDRILYIHPGVIRGRIGPAGGRGAPAPRPVATPLRPVS